jgi:hypothetical protein
MDGPFARVLAFCFLLGLACTAVGGYQCVKAHTYSVAGQREATAVGRITHISHGRGGTVFYHYVFSVNGVKMDDYSEVCASPLTLDACYNHGPVLVYYSYQPYPNSRLEDFTVASTHAYRIGKPALAIGLPLIVLTCAAVAILLRKDKRKDDSDPEEEKGRSKANDVPDAIHIVPGE